MSEQNFFELSMESVIFSIEKNEHFSALKLCHGFWETNVKFNEEIKKKCINRELSFSEWSDILSKFNLNWPVELYLELRCFLKNAHNTPRLLNLASEYGWKNGWNIERTPLVGLEKTKSVISEIISSKVPIYDGLFWKNSVYDGTFVRFIETIRDRPVLIVAPKYVENFSEFSKLSNSIFIEVNGKRAAWERDVILHSIQDALKKFNEKNVICLIEAGGVTSSWLVSKLYPDYKYCYFLALGQVLNLCNFSKLNGVNWFEVYKESVCSTISKINPGWPLDNKAYNVNSNIKLSDFDNYWQAQKKGYDKPYFLSIKNKIREFENLKSETACSFIENKKIDYPLFQDILSLSESKNHWANFGPVSEALELYLHDIMKVNENKSVILCKSATDATHAIVKMYEMKAGKPLRWVISSFGFISTFIGPLNNACVIDCNSNGILDIEILKLLDINSWDAVLVTNSFSLCDNFNDFNQFCADNNKFLLIDNAMAFLTDARIVEDAPCEIVSFHQTKPWGMGEGGCAIVDKKDETLFRSLINFGIDITHKARPFSENGKLSDFNSALILQRLINRPNWQHLYKLQARRIHYIATEECGLSPLAPYSKNTIMGCLPFLADHGISKEALNNQWLVMKKYYFPLSKYTEQARDIFSRVIIIPCHSQVADVPEENIIKAIEYANKFIYKGEIF